MKNKTTTILSVVAVLVTVLCITGPADASPPARPNLQSGAPTVVSYQGQVIADGSPYNGTGYFKFAIVDAGGTTTYWSNDGTSDGGGKPTASITLTVTAGLFNVLLGDTTLPGMTQPLTAAAFDGAERYLRVWFSIDNKEFLMLAPDRRIAAVPYALQAQEAAGAAYAANANQLDGEDGAHYQARVSGACAVGSTVRAINADGTVVCQASALNRAVAPTGNISATLDSIGNIGLYTSVTIGTDGLGLISYYAATRGDLKVAHCDDLACTSATVTTLDSVGDVGLYTSVTIGADGLGLISYYDATNGELKVAHCENLACTSVTVTPLESGAIQHTSVTIGADGLGLISFGGSGLRVAHCEDVACTHHTVTPLEGGAIQHTSVTIGADRLPLISYYNAGDLKTAHCEDVACTSAVTLYIQDIVWLDGGYTSVTTGADGLPLISYYNAYDATDGGLKVADCNTATCEHWNTTLHTLDGEESVGGDDVGLYTSVTIGVDGLPLISYYDATNGDLKVAHCSNVGCSGAYRTALDSAGNVGLYTSVTIGADGLPLISYYDATNQDLKVFHCANAFCADYFRRR